MTTAPAVEPADTDASDSTRMLARAFGGPVARGRIRDRVDDFAVDERLGFEPSGEGEHVVLQIEKCGENSNEVARRLARYSGVAAVAVGYAGMKDRRARTTQWFSVHLPGRAEPDWGGFETDSVRIVRRARHSRKLKRGAHAGNRFRITVRDPSGDPKAISQRLQAIAAHGVPNYFGEQRFGHDGRNIDQALILLQGRKRVRDRHRRGLYLSAARAFLFNHILSERVGSAHWNRMLAGDAMMLNGTRRFFKSDGVATTELERRLASGDIHPTGALWGTGDPGVSDAALALETRIARQHADLSRGLESLGVEMSRRALRLPVTDLEWSFSEGGGLHLGFFLPTGGYATAVLRELIECV